MQLQALRDLRPSLPLPSGWKCAACRAVFRECRCPQTRAHGHLNPTLTLTLTLTLILTLTLTLTLRGLTSHA